MGSLSSIRVILPLLALLASGFGAVEAHASVPIWISVKFVLDANGNRPLLGSVNSNAAVEAQIARANGILDAMGSEFSLELVEIVDLPGVSQWFMTPIGDALDGIRDAALDDNGLYAWRSDALNVYVNGSGGGGVAYLPRNSGWIGDKNELFVIGQGARPMAFLHEAGHTLNNEHTHESDCTGMKDDPDWTWTEVAEANFGPAPYSAEETRRVDEVFYNVMSYHGTRDRFAGCQLDKHSAQASYGIRGVMPRRVYYVDGVNGHDDEYTKFSDPLRSLDYLVSVLQEVTYVNDGDAVVLLGDAPLSVPLDVKGLLLTTRGVPRRIHQDNTLWELPTAESDLFSPAVRAIFRAARAAEAARDARGVREALEQAALRSEGRARVAIDLELAQRYAEAGDCERSLQHYTAVAERTSQPHLREHAQKQAAACDGAQESPSGEPRKTK